jgi:alkanesulfonate monooxygenase SsuD/methylene tetrahydromethanopterin reductase-like flavin-dependent oxidoreductase (luciferase family)
VDHRRTEPQPTDPVADASTGGSGTGRSEPSESLPLGLLDFLDFRTAPSLGIRRDTALDAAVLADQVGYRRFWVPEHHARGVTSTNPLVLLPLLGRLTCTIRIGTAVTLIRLRDPYLVAEDLATAAHFCAGRLDVGLGRGDAGGPGTSVLDPIRKDEAALDAATRTVFDLLDRGNDFIDPPTAGYQRWMNGAGTRSAQLAAELRFDYCHALFFNPDLGACRDTLAAHRAVHPEGRRAVALGVACNEDPRRARADADLPGIRIGCVGTPSQCAESVLGLLASDLVDEVIITEQSADPADHQHAVRTIAELVRSGLQAPDVTRRGKSLPPARLIDPGAVRLNGAQPDPVPAGALTG